ncbi:MAG: hypothetical protein ABMA14_09725 [Hyphomonadaceae bacterium]
MNRLIVAITLFAACAGCNTVSGFGKDLQNAGGVLAGTAQGVQRGATPAPARTQEPTTTTPSELCAPNAQGQKPPSCTN